MNKFSDAKILQSWHNNVQPWVKAIREGEIQTRLLVTNAAIVEAIMLRAPATVLDVGCGEGWLVRELGNAGIDAVGIDAVLELIEYATQSGGGRFLQVSYEELSPATLCETFDVVVCNFSLIGESSVENVFEQAPKLLNSNGALIVQTLHPSTAGLEHYEDGWQKGSWAGFSDQFSDPAPWYFRTMETWKQLFKEHGFTHCTVKEPIDPRTNAPASVIFTGTLN